MSWADLLNGAKRAINYELSDFFDLRMRMLCGDQYFTEVVKYCEGTLNRTDLDEKHPNKVACRSILEKINIKGIQNVTARSFDATAMNHLLIYSDYSKPIFKPFFDQSKGNIKTIIKTLIEQGRNPVVHEDLENTNKEREIMVNKIETNLTTYFEELKKCKPNWAEPDKIEDYLKDTDLRIKQIQDSLEKQKETDKQQEEQNRVRKIAKELELDSSGPDLGDIQKIMDDPVVKAESAGEEQNQGSNILCEEDSDKNINIDKTVSLDQSRMDDQSVPCENSNKINTESHEATDTPPEGKNDNAPQQPITDQEKEIPKTKKPRKLNTKILIPAALLIIVILAGTILLWKPSEKDINTSEDRKTFNDTSEGRKLIYDNASEERKPFNVKEMMKKTRNSDTGGINDNTPSEETISNEKRTADILYDKGEEYRHGYGVEKDPQKAFDAYWESASLGNENSRVEMVRMLLEGYADDRLPPETAFSWLEEAKKNGNITAGLLLGYAYLDGFGTKRDYTKARYEFQEAADNGIDEGMYKLGYLYSNGLGVKKDDAKANEWYLKAAQTGKQPYIMNTYAHRAYYGTGMQEPDYEQSFHWASEAEKDNYAPSLQILGCLYYNGLGREVDYEKAVDYFKTSANTGEIDAMRSLALCYQFGNGVQKNHKKAAEWYEQAIQKGDIRAIIDLNDLYKRDNEHDKAFAVIANASDIANAEIKFQLAYATYFGLGTSVDYEKALAFFLEADKLDSNRADINNWLGYMYSAGKGTEANPEKAKEYYQKAGKLGQISAYRDLGIMYDNREEYNDAIYWYQEAADAGDTDSLVSLGWLYFLGNGVEPNYPEAIELLKKAEEKGNVSASRDLGWFYYYLEGMQIDGQDIQGIELHDYAEVIEYWKKAAAAGDVKAMRLLGDLYASNDLPDIEYEEAKKQTVEWWEKAADAGDYVAMRSLGEYYFDESDGRFDDVPLYTTNPLSLEWYTKAAEAGDGISMARLAYLYTINKYGIAADPKKASYWKEKLQNVKDPAELMKIAKDYMFLDYSEGGLKNFCGPYEEEEMTEEAIRVCYRAIESGATDYQEVLDCIIDVYKRNTESQKDLPDVGNISDTANKEEKKNESNLQNFINQLKNASDNNTKSNQ